MDARSKQEVVCNSIQYGNNPDIMEQENVLESEMLLKRILTRCAIVIVALLHAFSFMILHYRNDEQS